MAQDRSRHTRPETPRPGESSGAVLDPDLEQGVVGTDGPDEVDPQTPAPRHVEADAFDLDLTVGGRRRSTRGRIQPVSMLRHAPAEQNPSGQEGSAVPCLEAGAPDLESTELDATRDRFDPNPVTTARRQRRPASSRRALGARLAHRLRRPARSDPGSLVAQPAASAEQQQADPADGAEGDDRDRIPSTSSNQDRSLRTPAAASVNTISSWPIGRDVGTAGAQNPGSGTQASPLAGSS